MGWEYGNQGKTVTGLFILRNRTGARPGKEWKM